MLKRFLTFCLSSRQVGEKEKQEEGELDLRSDQGRQDAPSCDFKWRQDSSFRQRQHCHLILSVDKHSFLTNDHSLLGLCQTTPHSYERQKATITLRYKHDFLYSESSFVWKLPKGENNKECKWHAYGKPFEVAIANPSKYWADESKEKGHREKEQQRDYSFSGELVPGILVLVWY